MTEAVAAEGQDPSAAQNVAADDKDSVTILDGADDGGARASDAGQKQNGVAHTDWRSRFAGEDKDALKRLGRFSDEAAFFKSYRALEGKLSSGEYKRNLPDGASEDDVKAWRKEQGIPASADEYIAKLALPNGLVLGEEDKPIAESFAKKAHEGNWTPQQYNEAVNWYYETLEQQQAARENADAQFKQTSEEALRAAWQGPEYRRNLTAVQNMLSGWPEGLADRLLAGRDPEGKKFGDDPTLIRQLAALAFELNPAATVVPASVGDQGKAIGDRIKEIQSWMGAPKGSDNYVKYWRDESVQEEYRQLIDAQARMKSRAA